MANSAPHNTQTSVSKSSFLDFIDEGRLIDWLTVNGKNIIYGLAGLLALLVIVFAFSSGQNSKVEHEYIQAANDFAFFSKASENQDSALVNDALTRLKKMIDKHPELHATYDGLLAQIFLNRNQVEEAKPYAVSTLERVKSNDLPFYNDYAKTTLLISQQDFKKALEDTLSLQQRMNEIIASQAVTRSFSDDLFALNLLRIGILQQELGDKAAELKTWQEWKEYAGLNSSRATASKVNPQAFRSVMQQLAIGSISIPDYISHRENLLKNK